MFFKLEPRIGFAWATRIIGFMAIATFGISLSIMRIRVVPKQKRSLLELGAFKERPYMFFTLGMLFGFVGLYFPIYYISTYAIQFHIMDSTLAFYMLPILNAASVFGRIVPNFYADRVGPLNLLVPCSLASGFLALCWIGVKNTPGLIIFAVLYGVLSGTYVSLPPTALVNLSPHLGVVGTRMGMCFGLASLGLLIGTPVSGAILNSTDSYLGAQLFSGLMVVIAALCLLAARYTKVGAKIMVKT